MDLPLKITILLGSSGQIGSSLKSALPSSQEVLPIHWSMDSDVVREILGQLKADSACDIVFAGGITNPAAPPEQILDANLLLPQKAMTEILPRFPRTRFLTLGTVMENFPKVGDTNPYLRSKVLLGEWMKRASSEFPGRAKHVRLHTVYGGASRKFLKPYMFLGQIFASLSQNTEFKMSSGHQMREYHHADDVARALARLLERSWDEDRDCVFGLNSGSPVRLADLARAIFRGFGKEHLLKIGVLSHPPVENLDKVFPASDPEILQRSRDPIAGVQEWLKSLLA